MKSPLMVDLEPKRQPVAARVLACYREHGRRLYAFALGYLGEPADAEDAVQEAFLRLDEHLSAGRPEENLRAWLFRVVTNLCHDILRSRRRTGGELPELEAPASDRLVVLAIRRTLARLDPRERALVLLRGEGLSYAEIAAATGIKPVSTGQLLARALARFAALYREEYDTEDN